MDELPIDRRDIGKWFRSRRETMKPKMTQRALAKYLDISEFYMGNLERGANQPGDTLLEKWCRALDCIDYYGQLMALKYPKQAEVFRLPYVEASELVLDAQRQGKLPKFLHPEIIKSLNDFGGYEGLPLTTESIERHYNELRARFPIIDLWHIVSVMPEGEIPKAKRLLEALIGEDDREDNVPKG